jgi:hypothetical protein
MQNPQLAKWGSDLGDKRVIRGNASSSEVNRTDFGIDNMFPVLKIGP